MLEIIFSKLSLPYGMVKCNRTVNFEEMDTECSIGKNYGFWVMWGIFKENTKQNIIMAVLRKENAHSCCHLQIDKKMNNVNEDLRSTFEVLTRRNIM